MYLFILLSTQLDFNIFLFMFRSFCFYKQNNFGSYAILCKQMWIFVLKGTNQNKGELRGDLLAQRFTI